jgi:hypothetical protein
MIVLKMLKPKISYLLNGAALAGVNRVGKRYVSTNFNFPEVM